MDHPENSLRAIEELQGRPVLAGGHPMRLRVAVSNTGVWVGDLPEGVDNGSLAKASRAASLPLRCHTPRRCPPAPLTRRPPAPLTRRPPPCAAHAPPAPS